MGYVGEAVNVDKRSVTTAINSFTSIITRLEQLANYTSDLANRVAGATPTEGGVNKSPERIHSSMIERMEDMRQQMSLILDRIEENTRRLDNNL